MKIISFVLIPLLVVLPGCADKQCVSEQDVLPLTTTYLNLDFEDFTSTGNLKVWTTWVEGYRVLGDRKEVYSGNSSLCIEGKKTALKQGQVIGIFPPDEGRGKTFTLSGAIKTHGVTGGYAGLWCQAGADNQYRLALANMKDQGCTGTTPWKEYSIRLDIPVEATIIEFGVEMTGAGKAWFDNLKITLDHCPYPQVKPKAIVPREADLAWIRRHAIPFKNAAPTASHKELEPLKKMIGNRRFVALGEATHGTREFFRMKHRLTRFLAEEMGFTVFVMETDMAEARLVNRYVLTGEGDAKKILSGFRFWGWDTREVLDMIEWMREYNQSGKGRIEFYGFDMWYPKENIKAVSDFVSKADPAFARELDNHYRQIHEAGEAFLKHVDIIEEKHFDKINRAARIVYDHLRANRERYNKSFHPREVEWVIHYADLVVQGTEFMGGKRDRDPSMAENLVWLMDHLPIGTKAVLWAHNNHFIKAPSSGFKSMAYFLHQDFGDDLIVFGFAFYEGEFTGRGKSGLTAYHAPTSEVGSIEWFLKSSGIPNFILDIRPGSRGECGARWLNQKLDFRVIASTTDEIFIEKKNLTRDYDALIYFEKTSASDCFRHTK